MCIRDRLWEARLSPLSLCYRPTGQRILFRGADDPMKLKSIRPERGYIKYAWYEEADEFEGCLLYTSKSGY